MSARDRARALLAAVAPAQHGELWAGVVRELLAELDTSAIELEQRRAEVAAADALHDAFNAWYEQATGRHPRDIDAWDAPGGVGDADRAYREVRGRP